MKRIFVSCPYRGNVETNMGRAASCAEFVLNAGHLPYVPHWALHWLEGVPHGDIIALYLCCLEVERSDEVWVFTPSSKMSAGMLFECKYARGIGVKVWNVKEGKEWRS